MRTFFLLTASALLVASPAGRADSQQPAQTQLTYADLADLALAAPLAVHVRIVDATVLKGEAAASVPTGLARFFVEAQVLSVIGGASGVPARISYVVDLPRDAKSKAPKLRKKSEHILLAAPVAGRPAMIQLVAPDAQIAWSADTAERLRAILREASVADAPPRIAGIGRAFHVPGALAGESETQIFLRTGDGRPVSITILRRPGETPQWAVALSEIVDEAAAPPEANSLLWYRLACSLPRALPRQSFADADRSAASAIQADYRFVLGELGACPRSRARR